MKKRIVLLLLIISMLFSLFAGCTSSRDTTSTPTTSSATETVKPIVDDRGSGLKMSDVENMTAPGILPIVVDPVTITIAINPNSTVTDYKNNDWTNWLQEKTGINIEFFLLPPTGAEGAQKIELMVASGQELPDIINTALSNVSVDSFYKSGVVLPLDEMMGKYCYYWNEMIEEWVQDDEYRLMDMYSRTYDGSRLKFPLIYTDPSSVYSPTQTLWLRRDWLKAIGKNVPTTTQELYEVLVDFRDKDPNGNNKKDEIPLITTPLESGVSGVNSGIDGILSSFIYCHYPPTKTYLNAKNGVLYTPATTDEYREGLKYINKLVSEGLLSTLSFTADPAQLKAIFNLEEGKTPYAGGFMAHPTSFLSNSEERGKYEPIFPLYGPEGVSYAPYSPGVSFERTIITSYCKTPEIAVRLLDFFCETETMIRGRWGVPGRDWDYNDDMTLDSTYPGMGYKPIYKVHNNPYAGSNNIIWKANTICPIPTELFASTVGTLNPDATELGKYYTLAFRRLLSEKWGKEDPEIVPNLVYTELEEKAISEIRTSLFSYILECQTRFAIGDMSIDKDWDTYLKTLESIGLSDYLAVSQKAYDRMNSRK